MVLLESQIKLKTGNKAPDFNLIGIDDKRHAINDYDDYEGLLVIFMCPCTRGVRGSNPLQSINLLKFEISIYIQISGWV